jgi:hypothetical protein
VETCYEKCQACGKTLLFFCFLLISVHSVFIVSVSKGQRDKAARTGAAGAQAVETVNKPPTTAVVTLTAVQMP